MIALIPGVIVSLFICTLFIAGILNILFLSATILFVLGIILFVIHVISNRHKLENKQVSKTSLVIVGFMFGICLFFFFILHNSIINGYDDYSHWATIVKVMLANNRLPRFSDDVIMFSSYPPGSACFIYYFCRFAGNQEGYYLFAQFVMRIAFLSSLFCVPTLHRESRWMFLITALFVLMLSVHNTSLHSLSVDGLLSCCGIYCFFSAWFLKENPHILLPVFVLGSSSGILIKNSGVYFYIIILVLLFIESHKSIKGHVSYLKKNLVYVLSYLSPVGMLYLWQRHVQLVFENGLNAKHSMSFDHYLGVLSEKSVADIIAELSIIGRRMVNPNTDHLLLILLALLIIYLLSGKDRKVYYFKLCVWVLVACVVYELGTLGMYILSMPHQEVLFQNGNDYLRYNGTLVTFMAGFLFLFVNLRYQNQSRTKIISIVLITVISSMLALWPRLNLSDFNPNVKCYLYYKSFVEKKETAQAQLEEVSFYHPDKYLVRTDSASDGYVYYMMRYLLLNNNFKLVIIEDDVEFENDWQLETDYTYCIDLIHKRIRIKE